MMNMKLAGSEAWVSERDKVRAGSDRARKIEGWLERRLRLEHGANIFPLSHVAIYYATLGLLLVPAMEEIAWLFWALWLLLVFMNYSVSIGIIHLHGHRSLFTWEPANRALEFLLCFPALHACATMRHVHVNLHHKYADGAGDPTSTIGFRKGWKILVYWIRYALLSAWTTGRAIYDPKASKSQRRMRWPFAIDTLGNVTIGTFWYLNDLKHAFVLWMLPMFIVWVNIGFFAWLTHAPSAAVEPSSSFNTPNRWMSIVIHNQGFHVIHHLHPGIHWTAIPEYLDDMLEVDDRLIARHWVLLPCALRILKKGGFSDEDYARSWKRKYKALRGSTSSRTPLLPYFNWI
jgi:fatty acid desaturase